MEQVSGAWPFGDLKPGHYGAIYADPAWRFETWNNDNTYEGTRAPSYPTMKLDAMAALPVAEIAARDAVIFMWISWPLLTDALRLIEAWGFVYKTCAFSWIKAHAGQIELFRDDIKVQVGTGFWTRANSEVCLLATRGKPKRLNADVRQAIIEPRREHSRKPTCVYGRIERLVAGPYCELFARTTRPSWASWGNEVGKFGAVA